MSTLQQKPPEQEPWYGPLIFTAFLLVFTYFCWLSYVVSLSVRK